MIYSPSDKIPGKSDIPLKSSSVGITYSTFDSDFTYQDDLNEQHEQGKEIYRRIIQTIIDLSEIGTHFNYILRVFDLYLISPVVQSEFRKIAVEEFEQNQDLIINITKPYQLGHNTILYDTLEDLEQALNNLFPSEKVRPISRGIIDRASNERFISYPIEDMLLGKLSVRVNVLGSKYFSFLERYLQDAKIDTKVIEELNKYFDNTLKDIETVLSINPSDYVTTDKFKFRTDLVSFTTYNGIDNSILIRPEKIKDLQDFYRTIKDRILQYRAKMFIIDRVHYEKALEVIAAEIVNDLELGKKVKLKVSSDTGHNQRSLGYVTWMVYGLVHKMCLDQGINIQDLLSVSAKVKSDDKIIYIVDDFVLKGYRMRREFYPNHTSLFAGQVVKARAIAVWDECKFDDGNEVKAVYKFPEDSFFTSTTCYCDDTFTESLKLKDLIKDISKITGLRIERYTGGITPGQTHTIVSSFPRVPPGISDTLKMQSLKPYIMSEEVKSEMNRFYDQR